MKVAILAGGRGTRLLEETQRRPKPLVEIGGRPVIWHVMRYCASFGLSEFVVALGYKGAEVRRFLDAERNGWEVAAVDTGEETETGGRLKRLAPFLGGDTFLLLYCDGLADVDLRDVLAFHRGHGRLATVTAVHPPARFGRLELDGDVVTSFREKPPTSIWVNGSISVLEPGVIDYIEGDRTALERAPFERLAADGQLMAYRHAAFWQCMDSLHEQRLLDELWRSGRAPWKVWDDR